MLGHLAYAQGSPSTTLVLPAAAFPRTDPELVEAMLPVRDWLLRGGAERITKVALIDRPSTPDGDLSYRFVQVIPGQYPGIELRGSCGHSILASLVVAARLGWTRGLAAGRGFHVDVVNNGDRVVCEVERAEPPDYRITAYFLRRPAISTGALLLTGEPATLVVPGPGGEARLAVSVVSAGNPYVFVHAADLGVTDTAGLFADDPLLFAAMETLRRAVTRRLGWPLEGAFPKIAALLPDGPGGLAARAISVPSWHPTIALTGAVCTAAAAGIAGTVPRRLAFADPPAVRPAALPVPAAPAVPGVPAPAGASPSAGPPPGPPPGPPAAVPDHAPAPAADPAAVRLRIRTPGGTTTVAAEFDRGGPQETLLRVGVCGKPVRDLGAVRVPAAAGAAR